MENLSICGLHCQECDFFGKECTGCKKAEGKIFWAAEHTQKGICPLYDCAVNTNKLSDCGGCSKLPCQTFREMKDPNSTDEEHQAMLKVRVDRLRMQ